MQPWFSLRKFKPSDLNQVMYINRMCLPENYSTGFFMDLYEGFPETFIVAEMDGRLIGYIMCRMESGFSGLGFRPFAVTKKGHVISIAVLHEHRHKGVGRALVEEALRAMSTQYQAKSCYLEVRESNIAAINLYKKAGFTIEKAIRGYYSDGENAYSMSRKLDSQG